MAIGRHDFKIDADYTADAVGTRIHNPLRSSGVLGSFHLHQPIEEVRHVQVLVRDNNVDQALRVPKKKMQRVASP